MCVVFEYAREHKGGNRVTIWKKSFQKLPLITKSSAEHIRESYIVRPVVKNERIVVVEIGRVRGNPKASMKKNLAEQRERYHVSS